MRFHRERDVTLWERVFFVIANLSFFVSLASLSIHVVRRWGLPHNGVLSDVVDVCVMFIGLWALLLRERSSTLLFVFTAITFYGVRYLAIHAIH